MKKILSGNEAIAYGAVRAGVSVATGFPGTPATEILETLAKNNSARIHVEWSGNEKSALETAAGAALAGARALAVMNQAGLALASDPLISLNSLGIAGALVAVAADDTSPYSSLVRQDTRLFAQFAKIAVFDPSSAEEAYRMIADAFDYSEKYSRPVILRPTTYICHSYASIDLDSLPPGHSKASSGFERQEGRRVLFSQQPVKARDAVEQDLKKMKADFSSYPGNSLVITPDTLGAPKGDGLPGGSGLLGIAACGICYAYAMEILDPIPPGLKILKAATIPFPEETAVKFLESLQEVLVLEEPEPVFEDELIRLCGSHHLRTEIRGKGSGDIPHSAAYTPALAAEKIEGFLKRKIWVHISDLSKEELPDTAAALPPELSTLAQVPPAALAAAAAAANIQTQPLPEPPQLPDRLPELCAGCPHRGSFLAVKQAVRRYGRGRKTVFSGSPGCCALGNTKPLEMIDACLNLGSSITTARGIAHAEAGTLTIAFMGDAGFFHSGINALINAVYNSQDIIVIVLDNTGAAFTGNQGHPGTGIDAMGRKTGKIDISALAAGLGITEISRVNAFDIKTAEDAVARAMDKTGIRLIIFEGPCIFAAKGKGSCTIDKEKCSGCMDCITKLGCPAISARTAGKPARPKAEIDPFLCTGCGICKELCSPRAIRDQTGAESK